MFARVKTLLFSVSERRFPTSHSESLSSESQSRVYPSGDSPQATATIIPFGVDALVYPSGDSPQATAACMPQVQPLKCIRAAIPHKPQLEVKGTFNAMECIRAAIPHKPQQMFAVGEGLRKCIRAAIPHKPQLSVERLLQSASVSERRFPTSHSGPSMLPFSRPSVSERRFPTSHSVSAGAVVVQGVYPSGDSPQATARLHRGGIVAECIRAAIPHKPQHHWRGSVVIGSVSERRFPTSHSNAGEDIQRRESVSERRFPTSHSTCDWIQTGDRSVSERRFPTSHSLVNDINARGASVSERRFPTSHSERERLL